MVNSYEELRRHIGHKMACVCYGKKGEDPQNVAIECNTCQEVMLDFDMRKRILKVKTKPQ